MSLRHKARRWFGATQETDENNHVLPLHSAFGVRLAFALGLRERRSQWIYKELYRRTCPELADIPFTSKPWSRVVVPRRQPEPENPPELDLEPRPWRRWSIEQTAGAERRRHLENEDIDVMRRYLLDDSANPVFDLVERTHVEKALSDFGNLTEPAQKQLYGALTAALWLGRNEITM